MTAIHHNTVRRAATLGATLEIRGEEVVALIGATEVGRGATGKLALDAAIEAQTEGGHADLLELACSLEIEAEAEDEDEDEAEACEDKRINSIVPPKYKARYQRVGVRQQDNGDGLAEALATLSLEDVMMVAQQNGIDAGRYDHLNNGQRRMNIGNRLRKLLRDGQEVTIFGRPVSL